MEGNNSHGYIQEDTVYDDLLNGTSWSGPGDQYLFAQQPHQHPQPHPHPPQNLYGQYPTSQPSYNHYDLPQQQPYQPVSYTASPYAAQYQHTRPSEVYTHPPASVDPSLQIPGPYPRQESSFSVTPNPTISPQYLQYAMAPAHTNQQQQQHHHQENTRTLSTSFQTTSTPNGVSTTFHQQPQDHSVLYFNDAQSENMHHNINSSVRYPTLPLEAHESDATPTQTLKAFAEDISNDIPQDQPSKPPAAPQTSRPVSQPKVQQIQTQSQTQMQGSVRMTRPELYENKSTSTRPRLNYAPFLVWEDRPIDITLGLKNTLPKYHPRKSKSGKELVPGLDLSQTSTPAKISTKKDRALKDAKPSSSTYKGTGQGSGQVLSQGLKPMAGRINSLRDDTGPGVSIKSPSTTTESSSSEEEEDSSEEESEDEEDQLPLMDVSEVRGSARPTDSAEATRFDVIGIIWKDPRANLSADIISKAMVDYSNIISNLRIELKSNQTATADAASRPDDATKLKTARKVLLESLFQAIDAANKHGHGAIVEKLGGNQKLVHGLTTTLIECIKMEDYLGKLPRAVFSLLAKFHTITDDLLKKTKFDGIQKRWSKKGDQIISKDIAAILANTTEAKEKAKDAKSKTDAVHVEEDKKAGDKKVAEKVDQIKLRATDTSKPLPNSAKRPHDGDGSNGKPTKKFASDSSAPSTKPPPPKRVNLLGIASKPTPKPVVKKREVSPPAVSKFGALLASIANPPEQLKAPQVPERAPETPEEKIRRERKESRRHLRVKFKEGAALEEIRLFKHEQAEDDGRQDGMLRDAHDDRSEGMMHKRRVSETLDDDDDAQMSDLEGNAWPTLLPIDFSDLGKQTKYGEVYVTRGGDRTFTTPEQQVQEKREALELMAIYTDLDDIPTSPKEPPAGPLLAFTDGSNSPPTSTEIRQLREPTTPWLVQRVQEIQQYGPEHAHQLFVRRQGGGQRFGEVREGHAPSADISSILTQLGGSRQPQPPSSTQPPFGQQQYSSPVSKMDPAAVVNLQRIVDSLKGKPYPPIEPPEWVTNETQRADWWEGYNRDKSNKEKRENEQRMAQMEAARYQQPSMLSQQFQQQVPPPQAQAYQQPAPQPPANMTSMSASQPDLAQQMQALLASYANGNNNSQAQPFDYNSWAATAAAQAQAHAQAQAYLVSQTQQPQQRGWENNWKESAPAKVNKSQDSFGSNASQRGHESKDRSGGQRSDNEYKASLFDENGEYKGKKKPCKFYFEGQCTKGAKCTYLHES